MPIKTLPQFRFLCFGVGAIGTYIGGSLALSGQAVVFLERQEQAAYLRQHGLRLTLKDGDHVLPDPDIVSTIEDALTHGPFDAVIFAVKSYQTQSVLKYFTPYNVAMPPLICLLNGVENEAILASVIGSDKIIPASVTTAVGRRAVGDIVVERLRGLGIAQGHHLAPALVAVFNQAGLNARLYPDAASMKWSKLLTNLTANASSAILNMTPVEIYSHPALFRLEMEQLREALRLMRAQKIAVTDLPGTPVRLLAFAARVLPAFISQPLLIRSLGKGRGEKMPSFHIDLYSGSGKSEVDFLNGAVVRAGEKRNIPVPVNRFLRDTLMGLTDGSIPLDTYDHQPEKFLAAFKEFLHTSPAGKSV